MNRPSSKVQAKARCVWSACGLPPLSHAPKAGASSTHSKRCAPAIRRGGSRAQGAMELRGVLSMNLKVGRVTPCAPGLVNWGDGAHGVTRLTPVGSKRVTHKDGYLPRRIRVPANLRHF